MRHLPLPEPWTIDSLSQYIDKLLQFVERYRCIAEYNTHDVFTDGLPVEWAPSLSIEEWIDVVQGCYRPPLSEEFFNFLQLSQELPLYKHKVPQISPTGRPGMCQKKDHEVDVMLHFISEFRQSRKISTKSVLDVGSGLGYLSGGLAKAGYSVIGVEGDPAIAEKASQEQSGFATVNKMVLAPEDLNVTSEPSISVSLHACGDLSIYMIQHFLSQQNVELLINIGCCYNKLSADAFPLSQCLRAKQAKLSQHLRQIAVQCAGIWKPEGLAFTVRRHSYRALIELLLRSHNLVNYRVGRMHKGDYRGSFHGYVQAVVKRHNLDIDFSSAADMADKYDEKDMNAIVCMRAMCAGVIESLIILDRWMYVSENLPGDYVGVHCLFDEKISPRNWAIVAARSS